MCPRCDWPVRLCWCGSITPVPLRTKFVFLMHPHENSRVRSNTGRLTHLSLPDSDLWIGLNFEDHPGVRALIDDPENFPVLLYPSERAHDLSTGRNPFPDTGGRRLVVFLLDATWYLAKKMLKSNPSLLALPHVMFSGATPSRYRIKKQPEPGCLSTLEATHELLVALNRSGLDTYPEPSPLIDLFERMQEFHLRCAAQQNGSRHRIKMAGPPGTVSSTPAKRRRIFTGDESALADNETASPESDA